MRHSTRVCRPPRLRHDVRMRAPVVVGLLLALPVCAARGDETRGPFELRDTQLLAQARLTLPPLGAATLGRGRTSLRASVAWGNTFAWAQDVPGETPRLRRYLLDGEALTLELELRRGLHEAVDVGLRVPLHGRGGGRMDGFIDAFHRAFRFAGVGDGQRPAFRRDAFRVEGLTRGGRGFAWTERGWGLGDVELLARVRLSATTGGRMATAGVVRLSLPSGTTPFDSGGVALGAQIVTSLRLGARADLHAGVGATLAGARQVDDVRYARLRGQGFAVLERRCGSRISLLVGGELASRLVRDVDGLAGLHLTAHAGAWVDLGSRTRLALAFVENVAAQAVTADLALHAGLTLRR